MRILLCDDNAVFLQDLNQVVTDYFTKKNIDIHIQTACNSTKILENNTSYDIAFLDIEMPEHNGLAVAKHLRKINENQLTLLLS